MTVKELKEQIEMVPDDAEVYFKNEIWDAEFDAPVDDCGVVNTIQVLSPHDDLWQEHFRFRYPRDISYGGLVIIGQSFYYLDNQES